MRTYATNAAPFLERPFYQLEDIEQMCWDELNNVGLYPTTPSPIRIDRFIEKRFKVNIAYEELPSGLLGFTEFGKKGVLAVTVSKSLDDSTRQSERRMRTTIAHEGGHGLLHAHLIDASPQGNSLFEQGSKTNRRKILCREEPIPAAPQNKRYDGQWWEYQANQAMGALLLPRELVEQALSRVLVPFGSLGKRMIDPERQSEAESTMSELFDVNPVVARLRLEALFPGSSGRQLTL